MGEQEFEISLGRVERLLNGLRLTLPGPQIAHAANGNGHSPDIDQGPVVLEVVDTCLLQQTLDRPGCGVTSHGLGPGAAVMVAGAGEGGGCLGQQLQDLQKTFIVDSGCDVVTREQDYIRLPLDRPLQRAPQIAKGDRIGMVQIRQMQDRDPFSPCR